MKTTSIHINCDMGESYGRYTLVDDGALIPYIDACNIACGFHAGDPKIIVQTIRLAIDAGIQIGAHPSFPDRAGFGRRVMEINNDELIPLLMYQIAAIKGLTESLGGDLVHVKPHGALYNTAVINDQVATAVARAVQNISKDLIVYTLPDSALSTAAKELGLQVWHESFIDRRYQNDLTLTPRSISGAVIEDTEDAKQHAYSIWHDNNVTTIDGETKSLYSDTMCIHGDNPNAFSILKSIRS